MSMSCFNLADMPCGAQEAVYPFECEKACILEAVSSTGITVLLWSFGGDRFVEIMRPSFARCLIFIDSCCSKPGLGCHWPT